MSIDTSTVVPAARRVLGQCTGVLLPAIAMLAGMEASYAMVPAACRSGENLGLHLVHLVTLLLTTGAGFVAWHEWRIAGVHEPGDGGGKITRSRFLGLLGLTMAALFSFVVIAQWLPLFFLSPCQ